MSHPHSPPAATTAAVAGFDCISELLEQVDVLLLRRAELLKYPVDRSSHLPQDPVGKLRTQQAGKLNDDGVKSALRLVQRQLTAFDGMPDLLLSILEHLVTFAAKFSWKPGTQRGSGPMPSKSDQPSNVDQYKEDTGDFWILETIHGCLAKCDADGRTQHLAEVHKSVVEYCMSNLKHTCTIARRQEASECLGLLSKYRLNELVDSFLVKLYVVKRDAEAREYVPFQRAARKLAFNVRNDAAADATMKYLGSVQSFMEKCSRGVLRQEICHALQDIFMKLMNSPSMDDRIHWTNFVANEERRKSFYKIYIKIYEIVMQWAKKKAAHASFSLALLVTMTTLAGGEFYFDPRREDVLHVLLAYCKKQEIRETALQLIARFVQDLKQELVDNDTKFAEKMQMIVSKLFPKKTQLVPSERPALHMLMTALGHKSVALLVQYTRDISMSSNYSVDHRVVPLAALASVCKEHIPQVQTYNSVLLPIVNSFIEQAGNIAHTQEIALLRVAVQCFPVVQDPKEEKASETAQRLLGLLAYADREVVNGACQSVVDYLAQDYNGRFVRVLSLFFEVASRLSLYAEADKASKTITFLSVLLESFLKGNSSPRIDSVKWLTVRVQLEALCVFWLTHNESWFRTPVFEVLELLGHGTLIEIEESQHVVPVPPRLCDIIQPGLVADEASIVSVFLPTLFDLIRNEESAEAYTIVLNGAWSLIASSQWNVVRHKPSLISESPERYDLWKNQLAFLCEVMRKRDINPAGSFGAAFAMSPVSVQQVFNEILALVSSPDVSPSVLVDATLVMGRLHVSVVEDLLRQSKFVAHRPSGRSQKARKESTATDIFDDERILGILTQVYGGMSFEAFNGAPEYVRTILEEAVSHWNRTTPLYNESNRAIKAHIARLIELFLIFAGVMAERNMKNELYVRADKSYRSMKQEIGQYQKDSSEGGGYIAWFFPKLVTWFPHEDATSGKVGGKVVLQKQLLRTITALLHCGPLLDDSIGKQVVDFVSMCFELDSPLQEERDSILSTLLRNRPSLLSSFILRSLPEVQKREHPSFAEKTVERVAMNFLHSVVRSLTKEIDFWMSHDQKDLCGKITLISLLHQGSYLPEARVLAVELAGVLSKHPDGLNPGFHMPVATHIHRHMFVRSTFYYSEALALSHPRLCGALVGEVVRVFQILSPSNIRIILQCLLPWIRGFGKLTVLLRDHLEPEEAPDTVLRGLLDLTILCEKNGFGHYLVERLWHELASDYEHATEIARTAVVFFMDTYIRASKGETPDTTVAEGCKEVFTMLQRVELREMMYKILASYLRQYPLDIPGNLRELRARSSVSEPLGPSEHAAMELFAHLAYEGDEAMAVHLPLLLQNLIVFYGPPHLLRDEACGRELLTQIVRSFGIRRGPSTSIQNAAMEFISMDMGHLLDCNAFLDTGIASGDFVRALVTLITVLSYDHPTLQSEWATLAFAWCIKSTDSAIVMLSIRLFVLLAESIDLSRLRQMTQLMLNAISMEQDERVLAFLESFVWLADKDYVGEGGHAFIALVGIMALSQARIDHFHAAGRAVLAVLKRSKQSNEVAAKTAEALQKLEGRLDAIITNQLFKGLTSPHTFTLTLCLFEELAVCLSHHLPHNNNVLIVSLLVHALRVSLKVDGSCDAGTAFVNRLEYGRAFTAVFRDKERDDAREHHRPRGDLPGQLRALSTQERFTSLDTMSLFCGAFVSQFPAAEDVHFLIKATATLLRRGFVEWRWSLLSCAHALLSHDLPPISDALFTDLAEVAMDCVFLQDRAISDTASKLVGYLFRKRPKGVRPFPVFTFVRPQVQRRKLTRQPPEQLGKNPFFLGVAGDEEVKQGRQRCVSWIDSQVFENAATPVISPPPDFARLVKGEVQEEEQEEEEEEEQEEGEEQEQKQEREKTAIKKEDDGPPLLSAVTMTSPPLLSVAAVAADKHVESGSESGEEDSVTESPHVSVEDGAESEGEGIDEPHSPASNVTPLPPSMPPPSADPPSYHEVETHSTPPLTRRDEDLPDDWEKRIDSVSGRIFYVNHTDRLTTWSHPQPQLAAITRMGTGSVIEPLVPLRTTLEEEEIIEEGVTEEE